MAFEPRPYSWEELAAMPEPQWLVDGLVHKGSAIFLHGAAKTGKSLWAMRVAAAVTSGTPLSGRAAKQGNVLYVAAERARLMVPRGKALLNEGIPFDTSRFSTYPKSVSFLDDSEVSALIDSVQDDPPSLLIIDTLRRCFSGGVENDNNDMTRWASGVEYFCDATGSAAIVIHHDHRQYRDKAGRPLPTDYAGGGALLGSFDAQIGLVNKDGLIHVKVDAANEGNDFESTYRTEQRQIGTHKTWIMLDAESPQVSRDSAFDYWPIALEVLGGDKLSRAEWHSRLMSHEVMKIEYPKLDATKLIRDAKKYSSEVTSEGELKDRRWFRL